MQVMKPHLKEFQKKPCVDLVLSHICFCRKSRTHRHTHTDLTIIVTRQKEWQWRAFVMFCLFLAASSIPLVTIQWVSDHHFRIWRNRVILETSWHFQTMPIDYDPTHPNHPDPDIDQDQFEIIISGQFRTILMFSLQIKLYIISIFVTIQEPLTKL